MRWWCRRTDAEFVGLIKRIHRWRWLFAASLLVVGLFACGAAVYFAHVYESVLGLHKDPAYRIGFRLGAVVGFAYVLGSVSLLFGLITGFATRKDRLLIEHFHVEANGNAADGVPAMSDDGG